MSERAAVPLRRRAAIKSLAVIAVVLAATALTVISFTDLRTLLHVFAGGRWPWLAVGIVTYLAYFLGYALLYQLGFAVVGVASRAPALVPVLFAGLLVNVVVPTGVGGAALFIDDAIHRGEDGARASIGVVLVLLLELITIVPFVAWGVIFLIRERIFAPWQLLAAAAFAMYLVLLAALLGVSRWRQAWVCRALRTSASVSHRVLGRLGVRGPAADWPERTAARFAEAARAIATSPGRLALAGLCGTSMHVFNILGLWLFVRGFGAHVHAGGLVAVFAMGIVLLVIVVIPQLVPIAQAFMIATFIRVGVAAGPAVATTLAFRGLRIGVPLVLGVPSALRIIRQRPR